MKGLFVATAAACWLVAMVALVLVTKRGGWDHTSAATRVEARRMRTVAVVACVLGLVCVLGWALTL